MNIPANLSRLFFFFFAMLLVLQLSAGKILCQWKVAFDDSFTSEDARHYSLPGNELKNAMPLELTGNTADLGKLLPKGFVPGVSRAVVRGVFNFPENGRLVLGIGTDWRFHGFLNGEPFSGSAPRSNAAHSFSEFDQLYVLNVKKGENVIAFHLQAGISWIFAATLLPMPENLPDNYRIIQRIITAVMEKDLHLKHEPLVFDLSGDQANVVAEFSLPVLCGIRFTPANGGKTVVKWNKLYGQREYRQIHNFNLTGLTANTAYNYDILVQNENTGKVNAVYSGKFTTYPVKAEQHRFAVFSDIQLREKDNRKAISDFAGCSFVKQADFIVALGDTSARLSNFSKDYFTNFIDILRNKGIRQPFTCVRGNHELWGSESLLYTRFFGRPYGAFTYGDTFYIRLDCGEDQPQKLAPASITQKSDMAEFFAEESAWLEKVIASPECRNAKRRIVLAHTTPFECNNAHMARNLNKMAAKFFYGENPPCKIDLWIAGHIHYPLRYDPVGGKLYGLLSAKKGSLALTPADVKNIRFPVYSNDGPRGGGYDLSALDILCREKNILVRCCLPDGKIIDEILITPGKPFEVKKSELKLLWEKK